ncbi:protein PRR14L [Lissotriton helveticus]
MLSSVLEAPVTSQAPPSESSVSTCDSEFYAEVSSSLLAEFEEDGSPQLELSQLSIVSGGDWSAQAEEKCRLQFKYEGTPENCWSAGRSHAAEESRIKGRNEETTDVMEAHISIKSSALQSLTESDESPLLETIKEAIEVTDKVATEEIKMGCFKIEKFATKVVTSETLQSQKSLEHEALEQMEWEPQETLEKMDSKQLAQAGQVMLEPKASKTWVSKKPIGWESQLAFERETLEVLKGKACGVLEQEAREALDKKSKEAAVPKALHQAVDEVIERETQEEALDELVTQRVRELETGRVLILDILRRDSREATSRETEDQENWAPMDLEALAQEAQEALEQEAQEALEREAQKALEQETREVLEYETRKRLEQETQEALEQEAHEAACRELAEQENWAAMVAEQDNWAVMDLESRVGLEQEELELEAWELLQSQAGAMMEQKDWDAASHEKAEQVNWATMDNLTREALQQETLELEAQESLQCEDIEKQEAWDAASQEEAEQENWATMDNLTREALQQKTLELEAQESLQCEDIEKQEAWDAASQEEAEQENWAAVDKQTRVALQQEALERMAQESLQCDALEELEQEAWDAASPEEMEQENWATMDLEAQSAEEKASIKLLPATSDDSPYQNEMLAAVVLKATEYLSRCKRTTISDMLDSEGKTQENAMCPSPRKESPVMEPSATRTSSKTVHSEQMIKPLSADSSECMEKCQPLTSCELSHVGTFVFTEPLTTLNKEPSKEVTRTDTECTTATVSLVPSAQDVYNTTNQEDSESLLKEVDKVSGFVLHNSSADSDNVVESPSNCSVAFSNIICGITTKKDSAECFTCDQEAEVPQSTGKDDCFKKADRTPAIVYKVAQKHAVQGNFGEEQLLHERLSACSLRSEDGDINSADRCSDTAGSESAVCKSPLMHCGSSNSLPFNSSLFSVSVSVTSTEEFSKGLEHTSVFGEKQKTICSQGLACDADPEKSSQTEITPTVLSEITIVSSSTVKEGVSQEGLLEVPCIYPAGCSPSSSAHGKNEHSKESFSCCKTSVKEAENEMPPSCSAYVVFAPQVKCSDMESHHDSARELSFIGTQLPADSVGSWGNQTNSVSISRNVTTVTCGMEITESNHSCHKQNVCSSSKNLWSFGDEHSDRSKNSNPSQAPVLKSGVAEVPNIESKTVRATCLSGPDLTSLSSLNDVAHISSSSGSFEGKQVGSLASDGEFYDLREKAVENVGLDINPQKEVNLPKSIGYGHHISTACTEMTDSFNTLALLSRSEDLACTEYRPQGHSTALCISEAAAEGVTRQGHCLQTATECSKEDALYLSKCNTSSHIMCALQLDKPGAKITKNTLANDSRFGHVDGAVDNMNARPNCSLPRHSELPISKADIPGQEDIAMCNKSSCDLKSSELSLLNPSVTYMESDVLVSGSPLDVPPTLGLSDLKCIDSAAIECSKISVCLVQSLNLNSSVALMPPSGESQRVAAELVKNKTEPMEEQLITCIAHQRPKSNESDLPVLSEKMTATNERLSQEHKRGDCVTKLHLNKQCFTHADSIDIADLKVSVSGLPKEQGAYENIRNAHCLLSNPCHSSLSRGTRKKIKAVGVDAREKGLEYHLMATSSKNSSKTGRPHYHSEIDFSTDQSRHCAPSTLLEAHVQVDSTPIANLKMSCKQFSTEQALFHGTFRYDFPEDMLTEPDLNLDTVVEPILQRDRDCQTESVQANHTTNTKEFSFALLQGGLLQDNCQSDPSKLELCKNLPPSSNSMEDVELFSASTTAQLPCDKFETKAIHCNVTPQGQTQDFPLDQITSVKGNGASTEITLCKPCLTTSHTQKNCNLPAKSLLGVECHPGPQQNSQVGHLAEVSMEKECKVPFKRKRVWKGNSKCASESMAPSVLDGRLNTGVSTGFEMERLKQTTSCKSESASMKTVAFSTGSQKTNSFLKQDSVTRSEVKNPVVSHSLACKTVLQEIKRPKLSSCRSGTLASPFGAASLSGNTNKCILSCSSIPPKSAPCLPVHQEALESNTMVTCTDLFSAFEGKLKPIHLSMQKKQPDRKCKIIPPQVHLRTMRKMKPRKSLSCLKLSHESSIQQEHTLLNLSSTSTTVLTSNASCKRSTALVPKQRRFNCHFMNCLSTKEAAVLDRLSIMANKLLLPSFSSCTAKSSLSSSSNSLMLPDNCNLLRSNRLLEIFSCINMRMDSQCSSSWSSAFSKDGPTPFMNQPIALYPGESSKVHCTNLLKDGSPMSFGTPSFPMAFHVKLDSSHLLDFDRHPYTHNTPGRWESYNLSGQPSEWTLSLFLSQCSSAAEASGVFREDFTHRCELKPSAFSLRSVESTNTTHERGRSSLSRSQTVCSMHGLHTVLALSSPGCYRFWTRRRNLGSRIPTVQRLFMTQFTQGLKGIRSQASLAHEPFSSLPYSLGRVLATWSRHGVSTTPSMFTSAHFNTWQPPMDIEISGHGQLPHMPIQSTSKTEILGPTLFSNHQCVSPLVLTPVSDLVATLTSSPLEHFTSQIQVHSFDDDISPGACFGIQSSIEATSEVKEEKKPQRVSQIRIRRTMPKQDINLTPMGLPRPKRIKKKEFSLEEIYTNKNYKSPPAARCLETIFEEPKEKNGSLVAVSQQKRKRVLEFQDFTVPRKRKAKGKMKAVGGSTRGRRGTLDGSELDALLIQKLMDLEIFLAEEDAREALCGH